MLDWESRLIFHGRVAAERALLKADAISVVRQTLVSDAT